MNSKIVTKTLLFFVGVVGIFSYLANYVSAQTYPEYQTQGNTGLLFGASLLILIGIIIAVVKGRKGRKRERKSFRSCDKKTVIKNQNHKCALCKRNAGIWDFDHVDGNI